MNHKGIAVLVYDKAEERRPLWLRMLLSYGFAPSMMDNYAEFVKMVATRKYPLVACVVANIEEALTLKVFRERVEFRYIQIVLILEDARQETVLELIKMGFYNLLTLDQIGNPLIDKMTALTEHLAGAKERRQHVRVQIMAYENARVVLTLSNQRKVTSIVKNLSLGGLQISFRDRVFVRFSVGEVFRSSLVVFKDMDFTTDLEVVAVHNKGLQLKFVNLSEEQNNKVAALIYERLYFGF
ncbi:MAG: PilZ domain-containing protein [Fibrobacter sp.]|nr:PilZ domain-containing protein [Fibrobacter sp.]